MKVIIDGITYVPASTTQEAAKWVRYIPACEVTEKQSEQARKSELYKHGDMRLVWVNEGDMYAFWNKTPNGSAITGSPTGESSA